MKREKRQHQIQIDNEQQRQIDALAKAWGDMPAQKYTSKVLSRCTERVFQQVINYAEIEDSAPLIVAIHVVEAGYQVDISLNGEKVLSGCRDFAGSRQPEEVYQKLIQGVNSLLERIAGEQSLALAPKSGGKNRTETLACVAPLFGASEA